jgi:hypothetical protein
VCTFEFPKAVATPKATDEPVKASSHGFTPSSFQHRKTVSNSIPAASPLRMLASMASSTMAARAASELNVTLMTWLGAKISSPKLRSNSPRFVTLSVMGKIAVPKAAATRDAPVPDEVEEVTEICVWNNALNGSGWI